jgi:hypothetical protein
LKFLNITEPRSIEHNINECKALLNFLTQYTQVSLTTNPVSTKTDLEAQVSLVITELFSITGDLINRKTKVKTAKPALKTSAFEEKIHPKMPEKLLEWIFWRECCRLK